VSRAFHIVFGPALLGVLALALSAAQAPAPYPAVEIDPFAGGPGVDFPRDYPSALADDIARELSVDSPTLVILRPGDRAPGGRVLRIWGTVTAYKPGNGVKRSLLGFGAGAAVVRAQVIFQDAAGGRIIAIRGMSGSSGMAGVDSQGAAESLGKKIAKLCKSARWLSH
jgi:Domain of unknown function (DUF4410)